MEKLAEFKKLLQQKAKEQVPIQTEWVKVKSVDWDEKTMVAVGELNGLDYDEVLLGLGSHYRKPVVGSLATIGIIGNSAACFMIDCEEVEQIEITDKSGFKWVLNNGQLTINGDGFGGIVKAPELKTQVDKNTAILEAIQNAFSSWTPIPKDGGAALKSQVASIPSMQRADLGGIENGKIKHGG